MLIKPLWELHANWSWSRDGILTMPSMRSPSSGQKSTLYCSRGHDSRNRPFNASRAQPARACRRGHGLAHTTKAKAPKGAVNPRASRQAKSHGSQRPRSMDPANNCVCASRQGSAPWGVSAGSIMVVHIHYQVGKHVARTMER